MITLCIVILCNCSLQVASLQSCKQYSSGCRLICFTQFCSSDSSQLSWLFTTQYSGFFLKFALLFDTSHFLYTCIMLLIYIYTLYKGFTKAVGEVIFIIYNRYILVHFIFGHLVLFANWVCLFYILQCSCLRLKHIPEQFSFPSEILSSMLYS